MGDLSDQEDLSARRIGDAAKQHVISWAKWMFGAFVVLAAVVGFRAYSDYQDTLKKLNENFATRVEAEVSKEVAKAVANYKNFTEKIIDAIVVAEGRQRDLKKSLDDVQKQAAASEEEIRKFQARLGQLAMQAEGEYKAYQLTLVVPSDQANPEMLFRRSAESFAREIGLPNVKIAFKQQPTFSGILASFNSETDAYEVNLAQLAYPDLAKHVAVEGLFYSKYYKKCLKVIEKDASYWDEFRHSVVPFIVGSKPFRDNYKLFAALKLLEGKLPREQVRTLAMKMLDAYQCDWNAQKAQNDIAKINSEQLIVPPVLLQEAFASAK